MKHPFSRQLISAEETRCSLQIGCSISAFLLWIACLLLWRAGSLSSINVSSYLLAHQLQKASVGVLNICVIISGILEEHCVT